MEKDSALVPYSLEQATIEELKSKYLDVTIQPDDKAAYAMVMGGLRECREIRLAVDAWHKERKAHIIKAGKHYDSEKRRVHGLIGPIEESLKVARKIEDDRIEAIKQEKIQKEIERVEGIKGTIEDIKKLQSFPNGYTTDSFDFSIQIERLDACQITEEEFQEFTEEAQMVKNETLDILTKAYKDREKWEKEQAEAKAEAERLAKQKAEQEAAQAKIDEANRKIEEEKERLEAERKEADKKRVAIRVTQLKGVIYNGQTVLDTTGSAIISKEDLISLPDAEFDQFAKSHNKIVEDREHDEEARRKADAEKEAKEKLEREERERKEKEQAEAAERERLEALKPIKVKLNDFAEYLINFDWSPIGSESANEILANALDQIHSIGHSILENMEEL